MTTIKDVAARAGVSVGTVSRVLANESTVKYALRERVTHAMSELDYRVNFAARALRTNQIDVIGLVLPDITNPFFAQLASHIEQEALKRHLLVMFASSHDDARTEREHVNAFLGRAVRGVVIASASDDEPFTAFTSVPVVSIDRRFSHYPLITTDHAQAAALVADHLHGFGHRHIAYAAGPQKTEVGRLRKQGFVTRIRALGKRHGKIELVVRHGQFDYLSGERIAKSLLCGPPGSRPTAIAAASDQLAIGILRAARDLGIDVPGELSVVGFDDIELANLIVPRLTTVRQRTDLLAHHAVERLFTGSDSTRELLVPGDLIERGSTRAVRD